MSIVLLVLHIVSCLLAASLSVMVESTLVQCIWLFCALSWACSVGMDIAKLLNKK